MGVNVLPAFVDPIWVWPWVGETGCAHIFGASPSLVAPNSSINLLINLALGTSKAILPQYFGLANVFIADLFWAVQHLWTVVAPVADSWVGWCDLHLARIVGVSKVERRSWIGVAINTQPAVVVPWAQNQCETIVYQSDERKRGTHSISCQTIAGPKTACVYPISQNVYKGGVMHRAISESMLSPPLNLLGPFPFGGAFLCGLTIRTNIAPVTRGSPRSKLPKQRLTGICPHGLPPS
jgi:hypothetical protein